MLARRRVRRPAVQCACTVDMSTSTSASTLGEYVGLAALMGAPLAAHAVRVPDDSDHRLVYFTNRAAKNRKEAAKQALV